MLPHWKKISLLLLLFLCLSAPILSQAAPDAAMQAQLEQELKAIEAQIADFERQLAATKGEKQTLANKIGQLKKEQANLRLKIKATAVQLQDIQKKLKKTEQAIEATQEKRDQLKDELGGLIRLLQQKDQEIFMFSLTARGGLSEVFVQVKNYELLSLDINSLVQKTKAAEREMDEQHAVYSDQKADTQDLLTITTLQQASLSEKLSEQSDLLKVTQGQETAYQNMLQDNKRRVASIKSRIYQLLGVSTQINFGQAVALAQWVSTQTGVPTAFLLAILTQESNLGKNVGTCNRPGDPPEKSWTVIMKPDRDQEPFKIITTELGRNPDVTPVSCPMRDKNGKQIGWGGAMGPAQFIPSTWMGYKNKVAALTGKSADPWDIRDAFIAAGLLLKANGADETKDGQWKAAMRYFSGGTNIRYRFYGDNVLATTAKYEQDIKDLAS